MHLDISFWNKCNNNCLMCTNPADFKESAAPFDIKQFKKQIKQKRLAEDREEVETIYLTGGEPTIHPIFFSLIGSLRRIFPVAKFNILSNGRRFFYSDFVKRCIDFGFNDFIIPIHGYNGRTHDFVTGVKGSFEQTLGGIKNILSLRKSNQKIEIRIIITKVNYKNLTKILDFLLKDLFEIDRVVLIFMEYEGEAIKNIKKIKLTYKRFLPEFGEIKKYLNKFKEIRFYHFPLCAMPKEFWPYMWRTLREDEVVFTKKCAICGVKKFCLGIHKNYLDLFGDREFEPIKQNMIGGITITANPYNPIKYAKR